MRKPLVLILVLFPCFFLPAQPSPAAFLHYTTDQGLSSDYIQAIGKDRPGFLWVGTVKGLNRFDGRRFRVFRPEPGNPNSLPGDHILGITPAPDGWLWVATSGGLCKINPYSLYIQRITLPENTDSLENDAATVVAFDSRGKAWTTGEFGIYCIDPVSGQQESFYKTSQKSLGWFSMHIDRQDRLWLIKDTVYRFDPATGRLKSFNGADPKEQFVKAATLSLAWDASGRLWAGTWSGGIWQYSESDDEFRHCPTNETFAMRVMPDVSDTGEEFLWVGGMKTGLGLYYPATGKFIHFNHDPRDPYTHNNYLGNPIFKDPATGDVWIGTEVGLEHYAPSTIRFGRAMIPPEKDMGQFSLVSSVVHDNTDPGGQRYFVAVWGTGLFAWDKSTGKFSRLSAPAKLTGSNNFNLLQSRNGDLWACMRAGVGRYHPKTETWREYATFFRNPERNNLIWCALEDRQGNLWFGANKEGLFRYNPRTDRVEPVLYEERYADKYGNLSITRMAEDRTGRLWLACGSGGILRFDPATGETKQFASFAPDIPNVCTAVVCAKNGRVYAAFYSALLELDTNGRLLRYFTQYNGLKTNRLYFMVEDRQGRVWCNSEYLLHCFDPATGTFQYYGRADGLFNNTMTDALSVSPGGEIFVGFQNAFNFFYPERLRHNPLPPPMAITAIRVMNRERTVQAGSRAKQSAGLSAIRGGVPGYDSMLVLHPGETFFEIEFAALNFNQQERNRYAYLLEGFHSDWVYTDRPVATFTNLDGGDYILRMKAANNDGVWNEQGISLAIRVIPPFYRTWWFAVLAGLAVVAAVAGVLWLRQRQRRRLEKFRESLARDLHDEMGSTLSSIRFFSEFASQQIGDDKPAVTPVLQRIGQSASSLSESMQDIVWAMKTRNDRLDDLAARMTEFGFRLLEARKMEFVTRIGPDISGKKLHPEVCRNIYLIFKEALNNAAKYSRADTVELWFTLKKGLLLMRVSDNGVGFSTENLQAAGGGNGLQNMQKRTADIGGAIEVVSRPGAGTRVELRVRV